MLDSLKQSDLLRRLRLRGGFRLDTSRRSYSELARPGLGGLVGHLVPVTHEDHDDGGARHAVKEEAVRTGNTVLIILAAAHAGAQRYGFHEGIGSGNAIADNKGSHRRRPSVLGGGEAVVAQVAVSRGYGGVRRAAGNSKGGDCSRHATSLPFPPWTEHAFQGLGEQRCVSLDSVKGNESCSFPLPPASPCSDVASKSSFYVRSMNGETPSGASSVSFVM